MINCIKGYLKMRKVILSTSKLCKKFYIGSTHQDVIKNLDIEIYDGDFTVIMGPSGAGKSTLLYALSGMDKPTSGKVSCLSQDISDMSNNKLALFRRYNCGFVFQQNYLLDNMSALDNILACGFLIDKKRKNVTQHAKELLENMNLDEKTWRKFPNQISGGEAQRFSIVRALINNPKIIFADEPTGALDSANG